MRRIPLHRSLAGLILVGMLLVAGVRAQPADSIGRVTALAGQATQLRQGRFVTEPLALQKPVFQEDIIETGTASKVQLTLNDTTVISLGERSRLELTQFVYDARRQTRAARFTIPLGFFRTIVNKLLPQSTFDVITPTAVAAIRGTDLMGEVTAEATMIVVLHGTVVISNARPRFRGVATLTPGTGTTVRDDQPPSSPTPWSEARIEALRRATAVQ
jgi:hypothetical protein